MKVGVSGDRGYAEVALPDQHYAPPRLFYPPSGFSPFSVVFPTEGNGGGASGLAKLLFESRFEVTQLRDALTRLLGMMPQDGTDTPAVPLPVPAPMSCAPGGAPMDRRPVARVVLSLPY
jgi:hypothetical protein